jgi:hypothetical protein
MVELLGPAQMWLCAESGYECLGRDAATNGAPDGGSEGRDELDVDVGLEQGGTDLFENAVEGLSM